MIVVITSCKTLDPYNYVAPTELRSLEKKYGQRFDLGARSKSVIQSNSGIESYNQEYVGEPDHKAFTQSSSGAWSWRSDYSNVEDAINIALEKCQQYGEYCKVINVNGMWAGDFLRSEINAAQEKASIVNITQSKTVTEPKGKKFLQDKAIKSIFVGNTVYGNFPRTNNSSWIEHYLSDGRLVYKSSTDLIQYGKWRIEKDLFCTRYISDDSDDEWCHKIYKDNGKYNFVATRGEWKGTISSVVNYLKNGNPEGFIAND